MRPTPQVNRPIGVSAPEIPDLNALPLATAAAGPNTGLSFVPDPVTLDTWQVGIHPALEPTPAGLSPGDPAYMPWHAWYDDQNGIGGGTCGPADIARLRQEVERHEGVTLAPNSHLGVANTVLAAERPERRLESLYTDVSQAELRTPIQGELTNFFNRGAYRRAQDRFDRQDTPTVFAVLGCTLDFNASVRAALLLAAAAVPTGASAQVIPGQRGHTAEQCRAAIAALANAERDVTTWEMVDECGPSGARALAAALAAARAETGGLYLQTLALAARSVRHEAILDAAETVARDRSATRAVRIAALTTLLGQYDVALWFPLSSSWDQLVSVPLPACKMAPLTDTYYAAQYALPAGYVQRIRAVMDQLGGDQQGDPAVRTMAACLARYITP